MDMGELLGAEPLSVTEQALVAEAMSSPVVKKYLKTVLRNDAAELLELSALTKDDRALAQAHAVTQGRIQAITSLLSIEAPTKPLTPEEQ